MNLQEYIHKTDVTWAFYGRLSRSSPSKESVRMEISAMFSTVSGFRFADPWLLALLIFPVVVGLARVKRGGAAFAPFPLTAALDLSRGPRVFQWLIAIGLTCLVLAAARPQYGRTIIERHQDGRDLMLVIDTSRSMSIDDLLDEHGTRSDRLAAVFGAAKEFIRNRPDDRIGLVFFATTAVTSCPLTYDHSTAIEFLDRTEEHQRQRWDSGNGAGVDERGEAGFVGDATNLGLGMGYAIKSMINPNQRGRAMIIITDGADSRDLPSWVDPLVAARHAADMGIKVYGIGVGDPQGTYTRKDIFGRTMSIHTPSQLLPDMSRLDSIVTIGGGVSFPANDKSALQLMLKRIDVLEPTPHQVSTSEDFTDRFELPLAVGLALTSLALLVEPRLRGIV